MRRNGFDVVVAGGGVIGLSCAWRLAQEGHRVRVVDRDLSGRGMSAVGSAGMIVPSHFVPLAAPGAVLQALRWLPDPSSPFHLRLRPDVQLARWAWRFLRSATHANVRRAAPVLIRLHLASREAYIRLHEETEGGIGLVKSGLLMLCASDHGMRDEVGTAELAREHGLDPQVLDAGTVHGEEPAASRRVIGGVFYPEDCYLDPRRLVDVLRRRAVDAGAMVDEAEVTAVDVRGSRVTGVTTTTGRHDAEWVVIAAGAHSAKLTRPLGIHLLVEGGRGYSVDLRANGASPQRCAIYSEGRIAITPLGEVVRVGGTMEVVDLGRPPDPRRVEGIRRAFLHAYAASWPEESSESMAWSGFRPCSADGMPLIGATRSIAGMVVATGHAMMGVSLAPATADLVAASIASGGGDDQDVLDPERFRRWFDGMRAGRSKEATWN